MNRISIIKTIKGLFSKKVTVKEAKKLSKKYIADITSLQVLLKTLVCPNCKRDKSIVLMNYEMGKGGWEAAIGCTKCASKGIFNSNGLNFNLNVNKILKENT